MEYQEMTRTLMQHGYHFLRQCKGTHELWKHRLGGTILVTRSGLKDTHARQNWLKDLQRAAMPISHT